MASVEDVPVDLRAIARRIPGETLAMMTPTEAALRCRNIHELQSRAANEPPDKAGRTRKLAEKVLRSVSDYSYSATQADLSEALADANRRGDSGGLTKLSRSLMPCGPVIRECLWTLLWAMRPGSSPRPWRAG